MLDRILSSAAFAAAVTTLMIAAAGLTASVHGSPFRIVADTLSR